MGFYLVQAELARFRYSQLRAAPVVLWMMFEEDALERRELRRVCCFLRGGRFLDLIFCADVTGVLEKWVCGERGFLEKPLAPRGFDYRL